MMVSYEAKTYSRGRASVMGVATALIIWFHVDMPMQTAAGEFLKMICDIGVDMFLLASGVGIYFAAKKYNSYGTYLISRLRRILPAFLCVSIPWYAWQEWTVGSGSWADYIKKVTTLSFWLDGDWSCWFVPAILLLYLLTPALLKAWKRWDWAWSAAMVGAVALALAVQHTILIVYLGNQLIFLGRIPAYLLGLRLGRAMEENHCFRISLPVTGLVLAMSILVLLSFGGYLPVQIPWVYKYYAYLPVMLSLSVMSSRMPNLRVLKGLGLVSLECYLLFEKIQTILAGQSWMWPLIVRGDVYRPLVAVILTVPAAFLLRWLCGGSWIRGWNLDKTIEKQ